MKKNILLRVAAGEYGYPSGLIVPQIKGMEHSEMTEQIMVLSPLFDKVQDCGLNNPDSKTIEEHLANSENGIMRIGNEFITSVKRLNFDTEEYEQGYGLYKIEEVDTSKVWTINDPHGNHEIAYLEDVEPEAGKLNFLPTLDEITDRQEWHLTSHWRDIENDYMYPSERPVLPNDQERLYITNKNMNFNDMILTRYTVDVLDIDNKSIKIMTSREEYLDEGKSIKIPKSKTMSDVNPILYHNQEHIKNFKADESYVPEDIDFLSYIAVYDNENPFGLELNEDDLKDLETDTSLKR